MADRTNTIQLINRYVGMLPEVYRTGAATAVFDVPGKLAQAGKNARSVTIPVTDMDGLADYSRNSGYVNRRTGLKYESYTYNYDRGGKFSVDSMDDAETDAIAFGTLSASLMRDRVVPEVDAFRFATYASAEGIFKKESTLNTAESTIVAIREASNAMDEAEVNAAGRFLFITPTLRNALDDMDTTKSRAVLDGFEKVIKVPQNRFKTAINLLDGESENELEGGFDAADGASDINFMIIEKSAVIQHTKHVVSKIITPEQNQQADAWMFFYRAYAIADVYKQKRKGIYLNYAPAVGG